MTTNEEWIDELFDNNEEDVHPYGTEYDLPTIKQAILSKLQEEYKRGYIDGGIAQLTKQEEQ